MDRRILHLGALIATFPLVASVMEDIGRAFSLQGTADVDDVRALARSRWGDRESVAVGARKVYTTLRLFGVVAGSGRERLEPGARVDVSAVLASWLAHALIVGRGSESMDEDAFTAAPELFWARLSGHSDEYELLGRHTEGSQRTSLSPRRRLGNAASGALFWQRPLAEKDVDQASVAPKLLKEMR